MKMILQPTAHPYQVKFQNKVEPIEDSALKLAEKIYNRIIENQSSPNKLGLIKVIQEALKEENAFLSWWSINDFCFTSISSFILWKIA